LREGELGLTVLLEVEFDEGGGVLDDGGGGFMDDMRDQE
jgi:hypothetical protein